ncbi:trypsin-like peptidase domain-containing protein [Caulobacter sp. ErkDOM-YI]|uniref:trypsin-like peptidase domain-containing protein n=1 Tax=unclassified Caulobacter TaxID=2648921 RepID=UPI003AF5C57A
MRLTDHELLPVLRIEYVRGPATAILVTVGGKGYVVTAGHVVEGLQPGDNIRFRVDESWSALPIESVRFGVRDDIAILTSPLLGPNSGLPEERINGFITVGSTASYCGFPLGIEGVRPEGHRWPIPMVKAAIYSGSTNLEGPMVHLFDTVNNKGFSGGPIYVNDGTAIPKLCAIVSGYKFDRPIPLMRRDEQGGFVEDPVHFVQPNSGFMLAVPILRALELIQEG